MNKPENSQGKPQETSENVQKYESKPLLSDYGRERVETYRQQLTIENQSILNDPMLSDFKEIELQRNLTIILFIDSFLL